MIFLDTNFFLRYLTVATVPELRRMQMVAAELFQSIERGDVEATTTEAVLHEVCYLLSSKQHYGISWTEISAYMSPLISMRNLRFARGERRLYVRALEIAVEHRRLGFADSIIAARCESAGFELATFDDKLASFSGLRRWIPPT